MKPMFRWTGGKRNEIKLFKHHYPENFEMFVEPFVGAGAVFFDLAFSNNVISDVHEGAINFYNEMANGNAMAIYELMSRHPNNEKTYYYVRDEFCPQNEIELAFQFYYLRKTSFRGMLRYNKSGKYNVPFGKLKWYNYEDLKDERYTELLKNTQVFGCSFESIFERFDNENYFYFLDPPYDSVFQDYGYCSFGRAEHERLAKCFKATKSKCLMVIGETDFIRDLYSNYIVDKYNKKYIFKFYYGRVGDEIDNNHLVIKNY